jgi:hypothetical protein
MVSFFALPTRKRVNELPAQDALDGLRDVTGFSVLAILAIPAILAILNLPVPAGT